MLDKIYHALISIHALREEGDSDIIRDSIIAYCISIHALREEGDPGFKPDQVFKSIDFYPRPPRGGRHLNLMNEQREKFISIHALREEGDRDSTQSGAVTRTISIHALREEGDKDSAGGVRRRLIFLSTPSARRATSPFPQAARPPENFYPRPPRGGRRGCGRRSLSIRSFLSTPSARRATHIRLTV